MWAIFLTFCSCLLEPVISGCQCLNTVVYCEHTIGPHSCNRNPTSMSLRLVQECVPDLKTAYPSLQTLVVDSSEAFCACLNDTCGIKITGCPNYQPECDDDDKSLSSGSIQPHKIVIFVSSAVAILLLLFIVLCALRYLKTSESESVNEDSDTAGPTAKTRLNVGRDYDSADSHMSHDAAPSAFTFG